MAIQSTDLILVGRGGGSFHTTADELITFVQSGAGLTYRGTVDVTAAPAGLDPDPPVAGDLYLNSGDGAADAGWAGIAGQTATAGDRVVFDGTNWALITSGSSDVGVETVTAANGATDPITVGGTAADVTLTVKDATVLQKGVNNLASTPDGAGVIATDGNLIKEHYDDLLARIGTAAGGGIQGVTGIDPIEVSVDGVTHIAEVGVKSADSLGQAGVVELATDAETIAGTNATKAVTPAGAAAAYVPLNLSKLSPLS